MVALVHIEAPTPGGQESLKQGIILTTIEAAARHMNSLVARRGVLDDVQALLKERLANLQSDPLRMYPIPGVGHDPLRSATVIIHLTPHALGVQRALLICAASGRRWRRTLDASSAPLLSRLQFVSSRSLRVN